MGPPEIEKPAEKEGSMKVNEFLGIMLSLTAIPVFGIGLGAIHLFGDRIGNFVFGFVTAIWISFWTGSALTYLLIFGHKENFVKKGK